MKMSYIIWILIVIVVIVGGVFWFMQQSSTSVSIAPSDLTQTGTTGTTSTVTLATSDTLGNYLAAGTNGMTLYTSSNDSTGVSNCTDTCATSWRPYTVVSVDGLTAGAGITGTLGTITRGDGTLQVTYNGMPLYFWSQDVKTGDTTGEGTDGTWNVATP